MNETHEPPTSADGELLLQCFAAGPGDPTLVLEQLCRAHPARADELRRLYASLDRFGLAREPPAEPAPRERIGPYRVLELLGSGGMGLVWLAEHESLSRRVALKVLHPGLADTPKARERFRREALAAAKLDHPGICPVYEVGSADGAPFLAMRYVPGRSLQETLAQSRKAGRHHVELPRRAGDDEHAAILRFVEDAARALHAAHDAGLVHRDVKPGNLLVASEGDPVLVDFGLARLEDSDDGSLTRTGDQLGTPSYMAPEQITGGPVDRRTDVYALGVVLYECLTMVLPFEAANHHDLQSRILRDETPDPRRTHRSISRDTWTVLQMALAKEPARRYYSAAALAEDLRRLRLHEPIVARPASKVLRLVRWAQRHPTAVGALLVLTIGLVAFGLLFAESEGRLRVAIANEQALRANNLGLMSPRDATRAALAAVETLENPETMSALHWALAQDLERAQFAHTATVWMAEFDPLGQLLLTCSDDASAKLWTLDGQCLVPPLVHGAACNWAEWSPAGDCFVTASMDGTVRLYRRDGTPLHPPFVLDPALQRGEARSLPDAVFDGSVAAYPWAARFSHDGTMLATTSADRLVRIFDVASGAQIGEPLRHEGPLGGSVWSAHGQLATLEDCGQIHPGSLQFAVKVWQPGRHGHRLLWTLPMPGSTLSASFSPDGSQLVVACQDGNAWLHDLTASDPVRTRVPLRHGSEVWKCAFSPNGEQIVTACVDGTVRTFARSGQPLHLARCEGEVFDACWTRDGRRILAASADNTVRVFDEVLNEVRILRGHGERIVSVRESYDGKHIVSASWDRTARLWDLVDAKTPRLFGHESQVRGLANLRNGRVASIANDRTLRSWDLTIGEAKVLPLAAIPRGIMIDAQGATALLGHDDAVARRYDLASGQLLAEFPDARGIFVSAIFLPDGSVLTSGYHPQRTQWQPDGTSPRPWGTRRGLRTYCLAGPTSAGLIAAAGWGTRLTIWDRAGVQLCQERIDPSWTGDGPPVWTNAIAFAPNEAAIAVASDDRKVRVFPLRAGTIVDPSRPVALDGHDGKVVCVAWSADGSMLASGCTDGAARLWDTKTWRLRAVLRGHRGAVNAVLFLPDGRMASGGADGAIQVWITSNEEAKALAKQRLGW